MATKTKTKKAPPEVAPLTVAEVRAKILEYKALSEKIKTDEKTKKSIGAVLVRELGKHGMMEFNGLRCKIVSGMIRTIPWRELAIALAKKLYDAQGMKTWVRSLVRKYPKKPKASYPLITQLKNHVEELEDPPEAA